MGRLLVFVAIIVVVVIVLGLWGLFLANRKERASQGLKDSERQIRELESVKTRQAKVLEEIRDLAQTEVTLAEDADNTMWRVVHGLANGALALKEDEK